MIVLKNIDSSLLIIKDLGISLKENEEIHLDDMFSSEEILKSRDLENVFTTSGILLTIEGEESDYLQLVNFFKRLTERDHERLILLNHNLIGNMFFETNKNSEGQTQFITYYKDYTKQEKIKEEHIIRDQQGRVSSIVVSLFDGGSVLQKLTQEMNRGTSGTVENIVFIEE